MEEHVVLVNEQGEEVGTGEKMAAHRTGDLHRAFSIFIFDPQGQMLIQQRNGTKYHSGGLWSNACCSHPRPGETTVNAAHRRLKEEMGFDCELDEIFQFTYHAELDNDLQEHEYDHVFVGVHDGEPQPDPEEVANWKWVGVDWLLEDVEHHPDRYTVWFRKVLDRVISERA